MKRLLVLFLGLCLLTSYVDIAFAEPTLQTLILSKANEHRVDIIFANAIIKVESNYNPRMRGLQGEYGLGQIKCQTAKSVGFKGKCDQLYDPETNLEYSFRYLKMALENVNGDQCLAASLYSTGFNVKPRRSAYCKRVLAAMIDK